MATTQTPETPQTPSPGHENAYLALVYHHPRGGYIAECPAFPAVASEASTAQAALAALAPEVADAVRAGKQEVEIEAVVTSITVPDPGGEQHTYTAIVSRDVQCYASYCPPLELPVKGTQSPRHWRCCTRRRPSTSKNNPRPIGMSWYTQSVSRCASLIRIGVRAHRPLRRHRRVYKTDAEREERQAQRMRARWKTGLDAGTSDGEVIS